MQDLIARVREYVAWTQGDGIHEDGLGRYDRMIEALAIAGQVVEDE